MAVEALAAVVLAWLVQVAPPETFAAVPTYPEAEESAPERRARYESIAADVAEVAFQESSPGRRRRAAALLIGIAWHESGFAKDVDVGPCAPRRIAIGGCDRGRAKGLWQIQAYEVPTRQDGARLALRLARRSMTACKQLAVPLAGALDHGREAPLAPACPEVLPSPPWQNGASRRRRSTRPTRSRASST